MVDVLIGHPQRALEDQRFEHRGVEPPVRLGAVGQGCVGDRGILQRQHVRAPGERVDVPDLDGVGVTPGLERRSVFEWLQVEVAPDRVRQRLVLFGRQAANQPVGGEHGQPGVLERHQAHQDVAVRSLAADLVG